MEQNTSRLPAGAPEGLLYRINYFSTRGEAQFLPLLRSFDQEDLEYIRCVPHTHGIRRPAIAHLPRQVAFGANVLRSFETAFGITPQEAVVRFQRPGEGTDWQGPKPQSNACIILSFESACTMRFRELHQDRVWSFRVEPRSILCIAGPSYDEYEHQTLPVATTRYSITAWIHAEASC